MIASRQAWRFVPCLISAINGSSILPPATSAFRSPAHSSWATGSTIASSTEICPSSVCSARRPTPARPPRTNVTRSALQPVEEPPRNAPVVRLHLRYIKYAKECDVLGPFFGLLLIRLMRQIGTEQAHRHGAKPAYGRLQAQLVHLSDGQRRPVGKTWRRPLVWVKSRKLAHSKWLRILERHCDDPDRGKDSAFPIINGQDWHGHV